MQKLLSFSIETDHTILLEYADNHQERASIKRIKDFVGSDDLKKIQDALKIRQSYFKRHLPKLVVTISVGGFVAITGITEEQQLNRLINRPASRQISAQVTTTAGSHATAIANPRPSTVSKSQTGVLGVSSSPNPSVSAVAPNPTQPTGPDSSNQRHHKPKHHIKFPFNIDFTLPSI